MPASIFGERFAGRRTPAWHKLGKVFDEELTATQAVELADIGFPVRKVPLYAKLGKGKDLATGHYVIVRDPTPDDMNSRIFGNPVGKDWTPLQVKDLAKILDPLTERFPVETAGALGYGEKIFMTLDIGEGTIAGEKHHLYYLVTDHRDGTGALTIAFTPVRTVCANTLTTGLNAASVRVDLVHNKKIKADAAWYSNLFASMVRSQEEIVASMEALAVRKLTDAEASSIIEAAYPVKAAPRRLVMAEGVVKDDVSRRVWTNLLEEKKRLEAELEKDNNRVANIRVGALERYDVFNAEHRKYAKTAWGAWQAVVETEDFRKGPKEADQAALYGVRARAKERAYKAAVALL